MHENTNASFLRNFTFRNLITLSLYINLLLSGKSRFRIIVSLIVFFGLIIHTVDKYIGSGLSFFRSVTAIEFGLLPITLFAFIGIFFSLKNLYGFMIAIAVIPWSLFINLNNAKIPISSKALLISYPFFLFNLSMIVLIIF
ncbi:MAG: hypothetical protein MHMPM18_002009 [Marteilia pararefringens]